MTSFRSPSAKKARTRALRRASPAGHIDIKSASLVAADGGSLASMTSLIDEEDDVVEEPVDLRCEYVSPEGVRCRNHARPGSHFCGIHADGQAPEAGADEEEESLI